MIQLLRIKQRAYTFLFWSSILKDATPEHNLAKSRLYVFPICLQLILPFPLIADFRAPLMIALFMQVSAMFVSLHSKHPPYTLALCITLYWPYTPCPFVSPFTAHTHPGTVYPPLLPTHTLALCIPLYCPHIPGPHVPPLLRYTIPLMPTHTRVLCIPFYLSHIVGPNVLLYRPHTNTRVSCTPLVPTHTQEGTYISLLTQPPTHKGRMYLTHPHTY